MLILTAARHHRRQSHAGLRRRRAPAQQLRACRPWAYSRSVAEDAGASALPAIDVQRLPPAVRETCERLLIDVVGLCVAARAHRLREGGARGLAGCRAGDRDRPCRAAQRRRRGLRQRHGRAWRGLRRHLRGRAGARRRGRRAGRAGGRRAGEAVRARGAARHCGRRGDDLPAEPGGAEGGAQGGLSPDGGVRRDRRCRRRRRRSATRVSASSSTRWASPARWPSGIIEYLADGSWTKRMHPGWAAQSGLRAALLARAGFTGPRTVFEGAHGLFHGFAHTREGNYGALLDGFGERWVHADAGLQALSVRHHDAALHRLRAPACAARRSGRGMVEMVCEVGEGTVHRLWEPLAEKQAPAQRLCRQVRHALLHRRRVRARRPRPRCLHRRGSRPIRPCARSAAKVRYEIDPANPYPNAYTGHIRARSARRPRRSRSASRICAAARASRCRAPSWRRRRRPICGPVAGRRDASSRRSRWPGSLWDGPVDLALLRM